MAKRTENVLAGLDVLTISMNLPKPDDASDPTNDRYSRHGRTPTHHGNREYLEGMLRETQAEKEQWKRRGAVRKAAIKKKNFVGVWRAKGGPSLL